MNELARLTVRFVAVISAFRMTLNEVDVLIARMAASTPGDPKIDRAARLRGAIKGALDVLVAADRSALTLETIGEAADQVDGLLWRAQSDWRSY